MMMTPICPRLLNLINDFLLLRFRARAPEDLSAIEVILLLFVLLLFVLLLLLFVLLLLLLLNEHVTVTERLEQCTAAVVQTLDLW